jgi:transcriptional regulator with XRE-family HTH domain
MSPVFWRTDSPKHSDLNKSIHHKLGDTANFMYGYAVATSVAKVVGANARTIRQDANVTLDRLAIALKLCGLRWSTGRIGSFESGHVPPKLETLYSVALALGQATGRSVRLADLLAGEGEIPINRPANPDDELSVPLSALRGAVSGKPVKTGETETTRKLTARRQPSESELAEAAVRIEFREADFRVCKKLGVSPERGALAMGSLWARTFSAERDLQAGPKANAQHRGNISRALQDQLAEELARGDD